jgi:hypothetical protein
MTEGQRTKLVATLVFLGVFVIYFTTMAPTTSFWDCGEFIACSYTLGVPHPPGSPLYLLLGRLFSMVPTEIPAQALGLAPSYADIGFRVNLMSPITGALAALFCFLSILRLIGAWKGRVADGGDSWSAYVGAAVGTFIFALAESNWFNAVESEVYAYAIFLMMFAFWLALVWTDTIGKPAHLSLTLFLAFLMGLSWGLHLLCLLVLPSVFVLGLFNYVRGSDDGDDSLETIFAALVMLGASIFVVAGDATVSLGIEVSLRLILIIPVIAASGGIIYLAVTRQRDAWILLSAATLMAFGGYFALHTLTANTLMDAGQRSILTAKTFGISDDPAIYHQVSLMLTLLFGAGGIVLTFRTKTVRWQDTWTALLVTGAAAATVMSATGVFFWSQGVQEFPMGTVGGGTLCGLGALWLTQAKVKPRLPALKSYHFIVAIVLLVVLGYSTYLLLLIRSGLNPIIDENNPENWTNLFSFLARKQYGQEDMSMIIFARRSPFGFQFGDMFVKYLLQQFPMSITGTLFGMKAAFRSAMMNTEYYFMRIPDWPLILCAVGMVWHFRGDRKRFLALFILFIISGLGLAVYLNMPDPQPRERHYVFTGATSVMAIWMGMGTTGLIRAIRGWLPDSIPMILREKVAPYSMAALGALIPLTFLLGYPLIDEFSVDYSVRYTNWQKHDRNNDTVGYDYAWNILQSCGKDGILFTNGDNDTFPLWYLQEVVGVRKDVRVVNLSLLNTDWYIKQLRHTPPTIPVSPAFSDDYITNVLCGTDLRSLAQSGKIDLDERGNAYSPNRRLIGWKTKEVSAAGITWTIPRPRGYGVLRVQDIMVFKIIEWVGWKRPIYFAVTVAGSNKIGLDDSEKNFLRMEGMVFRLAKKPNQGLDLAKSMHNLEKVYKIRFVNDQTVYRDDNMQKLMSNYRSTYLQQASTQLVRDGNVEAARTSFQKLLDRLPLDWRTAYTGTTVSRRGEGRTKLTEISRAYANKASELITAEIAAKGGLNVDAHRRARATAQLLRFSNAPGKSAELLMSMDEMLRNPHPTSGINPAHRAINLYEAAMGYKDGGRPKSALHTMRLARAVITPLIGDTNADQVLLEDFPVGTAGFSVEIDKQIAELEPATESTPSTGSR